ncbi:TIGR00730 family Rossman fold protein [candidate division KSB1 bacterium]
MIEKVCVYCASSPKCDRSYFDAAEQLGKKLADSNKQIIYGGGKIGLMGALADSALANKGRVTGIIPEFMIEKEWLHEEITEVIVTENMHQRTYRMMTETDAFAVLPGGCGTFHEMLEAITWKRLGLHTKPVIILNMNGYFSPIIEQLEKSIEERFMRDIHGKMWAVAESVDEIMSILDDPPEWSDKALDFANI